MSELIILKRWAFAGVAIGLHLSFPLLARPWTMGDKLVSDTRSMQSYKRRFQDLNWWMHLGLPLYMMHQFEEHGIDLYGRWYHFQPTLCQTIGVPDAAECPLTPWVTIFINMGTVWISGYLARLDMLGFGVNFYALILANAVVHLLPFILKGGEYNPGLLTALMLFIPSSYYVYSLLLDQNKCKVSDLIRATAIAFGGHVVIVLSLKLFQLGITNEAMTCIIQLLNILPLAIKARGPGN